MTKNPSRKLSEVFVLIIPQVIRIHSQWEECCHKTPRGMRIFVLIIPQVITMYFDEWEVLVALLSRLSVEI